jgi:hypothetical protein
MLLFCGDLVAPSTWKSVDRVINIDGSETEWTGELYSLNGNREGIGIMNDDSSLYLCFASFDEIVNRSLLMGGLTVWFGHREIKRHRLGLRLRGGGVPHFLRKNGEGENRDYFSAPEPDFLRQPGMPARLEIIGPDSGERKIVAYDSIAAFGIGLGIHASPDKMVYEIKVPLRLGPPAPFALDVRNDSTITVLLESEAPGSPQRHPPSDRGQAPEGFPGAKGGGMGGPPRGPGPGGGENHSFGAEPGGAGEPLKVSLRIRLATATSSMGASSD